MDRYELRRLDYSLSEDHTDLQTAYRQFFKTHSTIETVRAAEATSVRSTRVRLLYTSPSPRDS